MAVIIEDGNMKKWDGEVPRKPKTKEELNEQLLSDVIWKEVRNYTFRTCMETGKIIWPFEKAYIGTIKHYSQDDPVTESKWMRSSMFTFLRLTRKV